MTTVLFVHMYLPFRLAMPLLKVLFSLRFISPPPISTLFPYTTLFRSAMLELAPAVKFPPDRLSVVPDAKSIVRSEEHTSVLQSHSDRVCRLLQEMKLTRSAAVIPDTVLRKMPALSNRGVPPNQLSAAA